MSLQFDDEAEHARARSLGTLFADAREVLAAHDSLPSGGIFCTPQQYVAVLTDAAIVPGVGDAVRELMKTQWIDWNDRVQVGKRGRCAFQRALTVSQQLLEATREFCWFRPPPHLQEVRDHATGVTRQHAELLVALLGALTALDIPEFERYGERLTESMGAWQTLDQLNEILDTGDWRDTSDADERIGGALGVSGVFTDEYGLPDSAALFRAFLAEDDPLAAFAQAGGLYLQSLLKTPAAMLDASAVVLPLAAWQLALLDRPLHGFQLAARASQMFDDAWHREARATRTAIERALNEGWRLQEVQRRLRRQLLRLARAETDDEDVVILLMSLYESLAETGYRVYGTLALQLRAIAATGTPDADLDDMPMLGSLRDRLKKDGHPASELIHSSINPALRNVEAHKSWYWDGEHDEVVGESTSGTIRLSVDELNEHIEQLSGCIGGLDVALGCFITDQDLMPAVADWVTSGRAPEVRNEFACIFCVGFRVPVVSVSTMGKTLCIVLDAPVAQVASALWGVSVSLLAHLYRDMDKVEVLDDAAGVALTLGVAACRRQAEERAQLDFALFHVLFDGNSNAGHAPELLLGDCLVLMLHLVEQLDVADVFPQFQLGNFGPVGKLRERLEWIERFCQLHRAARSDETRACIRHVSAARAAATKAQTNDMAALAGALHELEATDDFKRRWVSERGDPPTIHARLQAPVCEARQAHSTGDEVGA